jgi:hypothetical protein
VEPGEALGLAAQVAVTPAGSAGVVVFRPVSVHQWSSLDRFRLRSLLSNSILPLAYSVIAIFLLAIKPPPESNWRWCSGVAVVCQVPFAITNFTVQSPAQLFHMTTHRFCVCELLTDNWCASFRLDSEGGVSEG